MYAHDDTPEHVACATVATVAPEVVVARLLHKARVQLRYTVNSFGEEKRAAGVMTRSSAGSLLP